ncbi:MAG TPA: hypothetical protein PKE58_05980 [Acidobacteriota bacterium]|nr:hypothetical protein [Acidobacteriota bacterium]
MPLFNFNYCAFTYLNQWMLKERHFCEAMASANSLDRLDAISKGAAFFRISRNFHTEFDKDAGRFQPVLDILDGEQPSAYTKGNVVNLVMKVRDQISKRYGHREMLSATTKLLWLKIKSPVIIYDSQARKALKVSEGNIKDFYYRWEKSFEELKPEIEAACAGLSAVHHYCADSNMATSEYIEELASQEWFKERVFDLYLWNKGDSA